MSDDIDKLLCDTDGDAIVEGFRAACGDMITRYGLDSIQIVATKSERMSEHKTDGGTRVIQMGAGNYYARFGSMKEWVIKEEAAQSKGYADTDREEED